MKKASLLLLMIATIFCFSACGSEETEPTIETYASGVASEEEIESSTGSASSEISQVSMDSVTSLKEKIEQFTIKNINSHKNCDVTTLTVFDAHNSNAPGTYKIYTLVAYEGKEPADAARTIIENFSKSTAQQLDRYYPAVSVMDIIWTSTEFNGRATLHFEKIDNELTITKSTYNSNFGITSTGGVSTDTPLTGASADGSGSSTYYQNLSEVNPTSTQSSEEGTAAQ